MSKLRGFVRTTKQRVKGQMDLLFDRRVIAVLLALVLVPVVIVGRLLWAAIQTEKAPNYDSEDFFTKPDG